MYLIYKLIYIHIYIYISISADPSWRSSVWESSVTFLLVFTFIRIHKTLPKPLPVRVPDFSRTPRWHPGGTPVGSGWDP